MNNIEKLAIEHGAVHYSPPPMRAVKGLSFTFEQLEAFAKALQSSEPVLQLENGQILWSKMPSEYTGFLFTHPPATVPLEKYNKLLEQRNDAIKALGDLSFECFAGIGLTQPSLKTYNETFKTLDRLRKAIAQAEGEEG